MNTEQLHDHVDQYLANQELVHNMLGVPNPKQEAETRDNVDTILNRGDWFEAAQLFLGWAVCSSEKLARATMELTIERAGSRLLDAQYELLARVLRDSL